MDLQKIAGRAEKSNFYLFMLNRVLGYVIPFNRPHKFRIKKISSTTISVKLPYRSLNLNHIKGIHACALATLCEFASGLLLVINLNPKEYRLIMKRIEIDFLFQAKKDVFVDFEIGNTDIEKLKKDLEQGPQEIIPELIVKDKEGNEICKAKVIWHIKSWSDVKTKL